MIKAPIRACLYGIVDRVTRGQGVPRTINGHALRLPAEVARYYPASYEPLTHGFLARHAAPGSLAIDGGAHIGIFTVLLARATGPDGRVLSFEPTPSNAQRLRRTVRMNGLDAVVECRAEALAATAGTASFFVDRHSASNANSMLYRQDAIDALTVSTVAIDDVVRAQPRPVSCIKIDVEGAEFDVLRGAAETLRTHRPALALDVHPRQMAAAGGSVAELWDVLAGHGYACWLGATRLVREATVTRSEIFELHAVASA
jgi:FkbM family methyltransferase